MGDEPGKDRFKAYLYSHLKKYALCLWAGETVLLSEIAYKEFPLWNKFFWEAYLLTMKSCKEAGIVGAAAGWGKKKSGVRL